MYAVVVVYAHSRGHLHIPLYRKLLFFYLNILFADVHEELRIEYYNEKKKNEKEQDIWCMQSLCQL